MSYCCKLNFVCLRNFSCQIFFFFLKVIFFFFSTLLYMKAFLCRLAVIRDDKDMTERQEGKNKKWKSHRRTNEKRKEKKRKRESRSFFWKFVDADFIISRDVKLDLNFKPTFSSATKKMCFF